MISAKELAILLTDRYVVFILMVLMDLTPTTQLPVSYALHRTIDLSKDKRLMIGLNIFGLVMLFPFGWLFSAIAASLRPMNQAQDVNLSTYSAITYLVVIISVIVLFVVLHEVVHGIFFWVITGSRPNFGFKGAYAFAAAPEWFVPRNPYLWIGLSPLLVISLAGVGLIAVVPAKLLFPIIAGLIFNAVGSVGDLYVVFWLFRRPPTDLIQDQGDKISVYSRV